MDSYIRLEPRSFKEGCNPTSHQRAIYSFYQDRYSDEADDVYSPDWYQRTQKFLSGAEQHPATLRSWQQIEDMEFGSFYLAHPVAAFALWRLLQAFYALDEVVCHQEADQFAAHAWQNLKPFQYLKSVKIEERWKRCLNDTNRDIKRGGLKGDALVSRLYDMLCGMERLEKACIHLEENFLVNLKEMKFVSEMLDAIFSTVATRRRMITGLSGSNRQPESSDFF